MNQVYYNEFDPKTAAWLRELIRRGLIAPGDVDDRSILDVKPGDLAGYDQCHFFAGIGGWSLALRLAGWADTRTVWTGSCPCQPFSCAGKAGGVGDERHLWPAFHRLIAECKPATVFGEQVASKDGRLWLAGVRDDLERDRYAVGAANLCAAGVGAPHIRQRLYWVADRIGTGRRLESERETLQPSRPRARRGSETHWVADAPLGGLGADGSALGHPGHADQCGTVGRVEYATQQRVQEPQAGDGRGGAARVGGTGNAWRNSVWLPCRDGKARRVESGLAPLAHGVPARVVRLRGYGNAIVPPLAAEFIAAYKEACQCC